MVDEPLHIGPTVTSSQSRSNLCLGDDQPNIKRKRKVLVLLTGGTMAMKSNEDGMLEPVAGYLADRMRSMPEIRDAKMPAYEVVEYSQLLDSADMCPSDWSTIAKDLGDAHDQYDGFVVILGTDTMAYCASALSFMLENLAKPVVLTGSMIPFAKAYSDARRNLVMSLIFAGGLFETENSRRPTPPEVCIFFHDRLLRGCRAVKVDALGLAAFDSPNFPPLATVGVCVNDNFHSLPAVGKKNGPIVPMLRMETRIVTIKLVPGFDDSALTACFRHTPNLKAVVVECYGCGTAPSRRESMVGAFRVAKERNVVVVATTQCRRGGVVMDHYAVGIALLEAGVVSAGDMTTEAAATKLAFLFGKFPDQPEKVRQLFTVSIRGEMSQPHDYTRPFFEDD